MDEQSSEVGTDLAGGSVSSPLNAPEACPYCQFSEPYPSKVGWAHEGGVLCRSRMSQLRQQVINTSIALYFTDGTQMRWRYSQHQLAVNELMAAMGNRMFRAANVPERETDTQKVG